MSVSASNFALQGFSFPVVASGDYPAVGDVREGVEYGGGMYTGTLALPDVGDVREGSTYGADSTELTGTLVAAASIATTLTYDYLIWDSREAITFVVRNLRSAVELKHSVSDAKRRAPTWKELSASQGAYTGQDLVWLIPSVLLSVTPKVGDQVRDANGNRWTVLEAAFNTRGTYWRLVTRDLAVALGLADLITIQQADYVHDSSGARVKTWSTRYGGVRARVQPLTREIAEERGVRADETLYDIILERELPNVDVQDDRIMWIERQEDSTLITHYLDLVRYRNPERIDELPVIEAKLKP